MFDADAAVTLLNRFVVTTRCDAGDVYLTLLHEGNLVFRHERTHIGRQALGDTSPFLVESLYFDDGSRALRVSSPYHVGGWTRWTAFQPLPVESA
jgi:hypothetical protein